MNSKGFLFNGNIVMTDERGNRVPLVIREINTTPGEYPRITADILPGKCLPEKAIIEKVIFNKPATVVLWSDSIKTVVKCQPGDTYSKELGLAMCISKKYLGNKGNFNKEFKKWISNEEIPIGEMRKALCEFCHRNHCFTCILHHDCECGRGKHFKYTDPTNNAYMTPSEVKSAYHRVFGGGVKV